jgi:hypothetical protein
MTKLIFALGAAALVYFIAALNSAQSADQGIPKYRKVETADTIYCGMCGCLHVAYDYHRELRSTYGTGFDPRNYDQTEFYYYPGRVKAYPHYWSDCQRDWHLPCAFC